MKMNKRLLSLLLAAVMIVGMFPMTATAEDEVTETTQVAVDTCEYCKVDLVEGAKHSTGCPTTCTCDPKPAEGEAHGEKCPLYTPVNAAGLNLDGSESSESGETTGDTTGNTGGSSETTTAPSTEAPTTEAATTEGTTAPSSEAPTTEGTTAPSGTTEATTVPSETTAATETTTNATDVTTETTEETEPKFVPGNEVVVEDGNTVKVDGIPETVQVTVGSIEKNTLSDLKDYVDFYGSGASTFSLRRRASVAEKPWESTSDLFAYDITILNEDGSEWQPEDGPVEVTLSIPDLFVGAFQDVYVVHSHDGDISMIKAVADNNTETITFITDGFSEFYGFVADLEYGDKSYSGSVIGKNNKFSIAPETTVKLSEILRELETNVAIGAVTAVTCNADAENISVEKSDNNWNVTCHRAFVGSATITVTHIGGKISIPITGAVQRYYLDGTNWNKDGTINFTFVDSNDKNVEYTAIANNTKITGTYDSNGTQKRYNNLLIYAKPGMAIRFTNYSAWGSNVTITTEAGVEEILDSNRTSKDGTWKWVWDSNLKENIVLISNNITEVTGTAFDIKLGTTTDNGNDYIACKVRIIIVPDQRPVLLRDALADSKLKDQYTTKTLKANIFDYSAIEFNNHYTDENHFSFKGQTQGVDPNSTVSGFTGDGQMNGGGNDAAKMGIVEDELVNGLPVMREGTNVDLFSDAEFSGKKVYKDVDFEFVYEPSTGYYTYSSNLNHAQLNGNKVDLYHGALGTTASYALFGGTSENYAYGGFYPFVNIHKAVNGGGDFLDWDTWVSRIQSGYTKVFVPYAADLVASPNADSTVNNHNGLSITQNFYLPASGKADNGEDLIFEFTGDDDLWVFIDGKLVLDIGGGHKPILGRINFTEGSVYVGTSIDDPGSNGYYKNGVWYEGAYSKTDLNFEKDQVHSISIFYLERYAGVSNCRMRFNIPFIPQGSVLVSKDLVNENDEDKFAVNTTEDYDFAVYTFSPTTGEDQNDEVDGNLEDFVPHANKEFTIYGTNLTGKTDANGKFTLKAGQTAVFEAIDRFTEVYVVEAKPNDGYIYGTPQVDVGGSGKVDYEYDKPSGALVMPLDGTLKFSFTNYMDVTDLTVTKDLTDANNREPADKTYEVIVSLGGEVYNGKALLNNEEYDIVNGKANISDEDVLVIENIPTNMKYSIVETAPTAPAGYRYETPKYSNTEEGTKVASLTNVNLTKETKDVVVYNELIAMLGNLKITKTGIDPLDHHMQEDDFRKQEQQSTVYVISGKSNSGVEVNMEVVIVGNGSVTINDIPVGNYKVTEKEDWSWRYDAVKAEQDAEVKGGTTTTVPFENKRTNGFWLSGDNIAQNLFKKLSPKN